jgi:RNA recognition motif-containing protein
MQKSIFVAGLDFGITSSELQELFEQHGKVITAKVVTDKFSGQSKGFGFVDMESTSDAQSCIQALNGTSYKNRTLVVKEKEDKPRTSGGFGGGNLQRKSW